VSSAPASALNIALRNGATCVLNAGALTIGETSFPLTALASAALVADMSVPVPAGMPPAPAVALRLGDGSTYFLTPIEQGDATRLLQAIHAARPDLAGAPPPPGPGYAPPGPGYAPPLGAPGYPGYFSYSPQPIGAPDGDRGLAVLAHLSGFFLPAILPLILWLTLRQSHPYASKQAKQAFVFQLCLWVVGIAVVGGSYAFFLVSFFSMINNFAVPTDPSAPPTFPPFPVGALIALIVMEGGAILWSLTNLIASIIASMQVAQGRPFHYPLLGRL
jgi:uncharacterized Tic20 family protein